MTYVLWAATLLLAAFIGFDLAAGLRDIAKALREK